MSYDLYPDKCKYNFAAGDYVIARCTHHFTENCSIVKGNTYRVLKPVPYNRDGNQFYDGVTLEEYPNRKLPILASRFVPSKTNPMPDNRRYYNLITMGDDNGTQDSMAKRHQADLG